LRHGEKENDYALCSVGQQRSLALRDQFLGKGASQSLFPTVPPSAFFATTLHTLELIAPTANSWDLPINTYPALPLSGRNDILTTELITKQTQLAAANVMQDPRWNGKTVVMVWEHKHIANKKLTKDNPDMLVDLRQLLKLDKLPERTAKKIPKTWSGANYNFFWIVDYDEKGNPVGFDEVRQGFTGQYANLPNNDWGVAESLPDNTKCKQWKAE
jgi:hypothetical protein